MSKKTQKWAVPLIAVVLGMLLGAILMLCFGYNPLWGYNDLLYTAFGSIKNIGEIFRAMGPLILIALGFSVASKAGFFNVGPHFQAGEFSFMSSDYSADDYSCAGFTSSAVGMVERINTMLGNDNITDGKAAFEAIHCGNKQAISIFEDYCYVIANQILSIQGILDVKRFVIGGGISAQKILVEEINRQFNTIIKSNPILEVNCG